MKTLTLFGYHRLLVLSLLLTCGFAGAAPDDASGDTPAVQPDSFSPPTVLNVKRAIGSLLEEDQDNGVTLYTRVFNLETAEGIQELFARCRDYDKAVQAADGSIQAKQLEKLTASRDYAMKYGSTTVNGAYVRVVGPKRMLVREKGKAVVKPTDDILKHYAAVADAAFEKAAASMLMQQFINWKSAPLTLYVIPDQETWMRVRPADIKTELVQTLVSLPANRELYVYINADTSDYADQMIGFGVAGMLYIEYARIITGKPDAQFPLFFSTGLAGNIANLEATITEQGPLQVPEVVLVSKRYPVKRPNPGTMLPLQEKKLLPLENLTTLKRYPSGPENMYYFLYESRDLVSNLWEKAPLALISLAKNLAEGKKFSKEICLSYMEMQRSVEGREIVKPEEGQAPVDERDYQRFEKYAQQQFYKLTQEYMTEEFLKERKKKKEEEAKKKSIEPGAPPAAETK